MMAAEGTYKAYFRGNGANVIKNVPETALKLTCNDRVKAMIASDGHTVTLGGTSYPTCHAPTAWCSTYEITILATNADEMALKVALYCWQLLPVLTTPG